MKPDYQHLDLITENKLIHAFWVKVPSFGFHWHYHPELEITYVMKGRGTRMVGDNVQVFGDNDFVFMGSNLPHTWISDDDYNQSEQLMEVAVLQFHPQLLSANLLGLPELKSIRSLLKNADRGVRIDPAYSQKVAPYLFQLIEKTGFERFTIFFELLNLLGNCDEYELLASTSYTAPLNDKTEERILRVCRFIHEHFTEPLSLEQVAKIAHMNASAFCRFFKKNTGQSIFEYINDLRINKACNLLLAKKNLNISDIAYQAGFNSQTLFNRVFLRKRSMTPSEFRKRFI